MDYDLFGKKAGEKIILSTTDSYLTSNIYSECLSYNLVPHIQYAPLARHYFADLIEIECAGANLLADTLARASVNQEEPLELSIPETFNILYLMRITRMIMVNLGVKPHHTFNGSTLVLTYDDKLPEITRYLMSLEPDKGDGILMKSVPGLPDYKLRAAIYRVGKKRGLTVTTRQTVEGFIINYTTTGVKNKPIKEVVPHTLSVAAKFRHFINLMPWDTHFEFPEADHDRLRNLASTHPSRCIKVVVDKNNDTVKLIKQSLVVGKHKGKIAVLHYGEPVFVTDVSRKSELTLRQQADIADVLEAYRGS